MQTSVPRAGTGFGGCGQSRLKNTWPSHQNPMRSSSLERKGRGPRAFRRPPHTYRQYHDKCRRTLAPLLSQPEEDTQLASLQSITRWNTGAHQREQQDTGTMFVLCHLHLCFYALLLLSSVPHSHLSLPFGDPQARVFMSKSQGLEVNFMLFSEATPSELPEGTSTAFTGPRVGLVQACSIVTSVV